jgi:hypothetical protein
MTELRRFAAAAGIISFGDDHGPTVSADAPYPTFFLCHFFLPKLIDVFKVICDLSSYKTQLLCHKSAIKITF